MTVSPVINRAINRCALLMLATCLALCAARFIVKRNTADNLKISQPQVAQETQGKSAKATPSSGPPEIVPEKEAARMRGDAAVEMMRETSRPWIREALHDSAFRRSMALTQARKNDPHYADVFKLLELDDATNETLRELLGERPQAVYEAMMDGLAKPGASLADASTGKARRNHDEMIAGLLGSEKYEILREYERTMPFHNQIAQLRQELEFSGDPLTPAQETALLSALERYSEDDPATVHQNEIARSNPQFTPSFSEGHLEALKEALSARQSNALAELMERKKNWRPLNYAWRTIGTRMRKR